MQNQGPNNKGSGLGVILYGMTLLLILIYTAINIANSKVIENGYNSLRDAVQTASSGSVIHLLTSNRDGMTTTQNDNIENASYDIYLQLALGYLINRDNSGTSGTTVQTGEVNNFIKLDHQKVVNTTLAVLEDAVTRRNKTEGISNINKYKIMMFFIEPYVDNANNKYFDIIAYGNENYNGNITRKLANDTVKKTDMRSTYKAVEESINKIVNENYGGKEIWINLGVNNTENKLRDIETKPYYIIVVKDFALPTLFDGKDTINDNGTRGFSIKRLFTSLSGDGTLSTPMCALNSGNVERHLKDDNNGWSHRR